MRILTSDDRVLGHALLSAVSREVVAVAAGDAGTHVEDALRALAAGTVAGIVLVVVAAGAEPPGASRCRATPGSGARSDATLDDRHTIALTRRQAQVLALMAQGKPNKLICRELNLSAGTVKVHVSAVLRALKASNRTAAVVAAAAVPVAEKPALPGRRVSPGCGEPPLASATEKKRPRVEPGGTV